MKTLNSKKEKIREKRKKEERRKTIMMINTPKEITETKARRMTKNDLREAHNLLILNYKAQQETNEILSQYLEYLMYVLEDDCGYTTKQINSMLDGNVFHYNLFKARERHGR